MAKQLSTKLSAFLLLGTVIILAVGVIGFGLMPIAPILAVIGLIMVVAACAACHGQRVNVNW